jgi:phosphohistidine phosphatase SixA
MHSLRGLLMIAALSAIAGGCATRDAGIDRSASATTFVIIRHAEKAADDPKDPSLSEAGQARAQRASERLAVQGVIATYATRYRRTQMTAAKTAQAHGLEVSTYDASRLAADFAAQLHRTHPSGVVLVVGHSNTVAEIAGALCGCAVSSVREDEYDRWIEVRIDRNGAAEFEESRY